MSQIGIRHCPRQWQMEALERWREQQRRGIVAVVTGGGKTVFAEMCAYDALREIAGLRVVIVVPTLALVDQWVVSLQDDLGVPSTQVAVYAGGARPEPATFNVMTLVSAREQAPAISRMGQTLLVVDECHRVGSKKNAEALQGTYAATLGLSATPEREHDSLFDDVIRPHLGNIVFSYTYADALRDAVISPFALINIKIDLTDAEEDEYTAISRRVAQLTSRQQRGEDVEIALKASLQRRARVSALASMRVPVAARIACDWPNRRTIIFHESIEAAEMISTLIQARGRRAATYHSRMGMAMRQSNLRLYKAGRVDVLVTCRALDEGVDAPETSLGVIASSTSSVRQRIQRLGRILRPSLGKDEATLVTLYATSIEEQRLAVEAQRDPSASSIDWKHARSE